MNLKQVQAKWCDRSLLSVKERIEEQDARLTIHLILLYASNKRRVEEALCAYRKNGPEALYQEVLDDLKGRKV